MDPQKPKITDWLIPIVLLMLAMLILLLLVKGSSPEEDLLEVHGSPYNVSFGAAAVTFSIDRVHFKYSQVQPHFQEISAIVGKGSPVIAWIAPQQMPGLEGGSADLLKLEANNAVVLSYAESRRQQAKTEAIVAFAMVVLGGLGTWGIYHARRIRGRYVDWQRRFADLAVPERETPWAVRELTFSLTVADLVASNTFFRHHELDGSERKAITLMPVTVTMILMYAAVCVMQDGGPALAFPDSILGWIGFVVLALVFLAVAYFSFLELFGDYLIKYRIRAELRFPGVSELIEPRTLTIHAEEFVVAEKSATTAFGWNAINRITRTTEHVFFLKSHSQQRGAFTWTRSSVVVTIPRRAFNDEMERWQFMAAVQKLLARSQAGNTA